MIWSITGCIVCLGNRPMHRLVETMAYTLIGTTIVGTITSLFWKAFFPKTQKPKDAIFLRRAVKPADVIRFA